MRPSAAREKAPSAESALARSLTATGLACEAGDVTWIAPRLGLRASLEGDARALVRASASGEPSDLYLVRARLSPEGVLIAVEGAWDVTSTSGVDESRPLVRGETAVYTTSADGLVTGVHVLDLAGAALSDGDFTRVQRAQIAFTNWQQTGQRAGVGHTTFAFDPIARSASIRWRDDGTIEAAADQRTIVIDPARGTVVEGETFVRVVTDERARPGNLVTWAVDRVRAVPWIGDDRMQWTKAIAFTLLDKVKASFAPRTTAEDVRSELGIAAPAETAPGAAFANPETGFPPAPIKLAITPALPGEGRWIALDDDPFITPRPGASQPAFVTSFVRPDARRPDERVYVTLWDPRQIELHVEAGTVEPISADGEHGPGMIPRTPEVMSHVVAAFNGGFQAVHGEYGMQANGIEYLPPKPYAASVLVLRDGSTAFGSWPDSSDVPGDAVAFRQNLTALVEGGRFNPWGRTWWGGTPPGWPDQIHSTRSAICLTAENFVGYFYSTSISAEDLGAGMIAARCTFGIHLDMNPGHAGFEFYDIAPDGRLPPIARRLQSDWEAEGKVPDMPGYAFRARRMIRGMGHMLFPRYVQREARDFFYLTARSILPGAPLSPGASAATDPDEGRWRTRGLPQQGFPYAVATAWVRLDADANAPKARVVRVDPRAVAPSSGEDAGKTVLSIGGAPHGSRALLWNRGAFALGPAGGGAEAEAAGLVFGYAFDDPRAAGARAGLGIQDEDGMLAWVELDGPSDGADSGGSDARHAIDALLARLGCSARMAVAGNAHVVLGDSLDAAGRPVTNEAPALVRFVRAHAPDAHPTFVDTPIVPIQVWQPLQKKRVRYFLPPPTAPAASASPAAAAEPVPKVEPPSPAPRRAQALAHDGVRR